MGTNFGGGLGMPIRRNGNGTPLGLRPIPKVRRPIEDEFPVPVVEPFRIGVFELLEERDDYLICKGHDPNSIHGARRTIAVAKPWLLQKSRWHGIPIPLYVGGELVEVTHEYTDIGKRIARATVITTTTNSDGEEVQEEEQVEETQRITMDYFRGDFIMAVRIRDSAAVDGVRIDSPGRIRVQWLDMNMSGRCWAVTEEDEDD